MSQLYDAIIVGSGAGGAATAYRLARAGRRVLLLEKGGHLPTDGSTLDTMQVFKEGKFKNKEPWRDGRGGQLVPDEYYNVGGKTKWYGAALLRFAAHEFEPDPDHQCLGAIGITYSGFWAGRSACASSSPTTTKPSACCTSAGSTTSRSCRH